MNDPKAPVSVPASLKQGEFQDTINVNGVEVSWDTNAGTCNFRSIPVAMMWVDSTLAGLMSGVQSMVGPERFHLALQSEGRKSVESDWLLISSYPVFAEGFAQLNLNAKVAGWGDWQLISHDPVKQLCVFRAFNNWEGGYQKALGVCWGSGMLAGKLAGICSKLFMTNCWSTQTRFVAKGDPYDEFEVSPSDRNLEDEIEKLLSTDQATRADMAVALRKLQNTESVLRDSQTRYQRLVSSIPIGVYTFVFQADGSMGFDYVSPRFCELLNVKADDVLKDFKLAFAPAHPEDAPVLINSNMQARTTLQPFRFEGRFVINGEIRWMRISSDPTVLPDGSSVWHGIIQDVTERRFLEQDLHEALDQAKQLARVKAEFLANMSHEIRTPMNGIIGLAKLALNEQTTPEVREYLSKIASSSETLLGILNDILDFSKLEAGRMSVENQPFTLKRIQDDLQNLFTERARVKGLELTIETTPGTPDHLLGDSLRIFQVLSNLMGNALKFTEKGKVSVKISGQRIDHENAHVVFSVEDTGIGMDQETVSRLFQPFSQADGSITRKFGGSGLGLAISHNLLKLMGSEFKITSTPGKGSCFSFELNLGTSAASETAKSGPDVASQAGKLKAHLKAQARHLKGVRVLIAEDDTVNQLVIGNFFKLAGVDYAIAQNGQEAIDILNHQDFDLILMDVHMPVMDGLTATRIIRQKPQLQKLPILALTAGVTREEKSKALEAGLNDFIVKPFDHLTFLETLMRWVRT